MKKQFTIGIAIGTVMIVVGIVWLTQKDLKSHEESVEKIRLGAYTGDTAALIWIAQEQGYFEKNRLQVTIKGYEAGKLAADALLNDEVDITTSADFVFVSNSFQREDLRILGTIAAANTVDLIARKDRNIKQPADLRGRKIGVTRKSTGEFFLGSFLIFNKLTLADIEVIDLKPSEIVESIANGQIDAGMTWQPNIYKAFNQLGKNAMRFPGQSGQNFYFILISTQQWLQAHPEAAVRFIKSLIQAEEFVKINDQIAQQFITKRFNYEPSYTQAIWAKHDFRVDFPQALIVVMEDQARWRIRNNLIKQQKVPNYLNFLYLDALEKVKPSAITIIR